MTTIEKARAVMHANRTAAAQERRRIVDRLHQAGHTQAAIADQLGVTRVTVRRDLAALGHPPASQVWLTDTERAHAARLAADGASISEIARTLGRSRHTIRRLHPEAAYTRDQQIERTRLYYLEKSLK